MPGMKAPAFVGEDTGGDGDTVGGEEGVALSGDARIGILDRRHHPRDAGRDQRFRTGRRAAMVGAGLQRHVGGGSHGG